MDRKASVQCCLFYRREGNLPAAAAGAVRLSNHRENFDIGLREKTFQRGNRELRGAAKNQAQFTTRLAFAFF